VIRAAALAALLVAAPASAAPPAAYRTPVAPQVLPGEASAARTSHWILGAQPGTGAARIARRHGARPVAGGFVIPRSRARALARALGPRLLWAEPDHPRRSAQAPAPPAEPIPSPWRDRVVPDGRPAPAVSPASPLIALVDSPIDPAHPEFSSGNVVAADPIAPVDLHGTATAAVAVAARNGIGIAGIWPGAPALNVPLPPQPFSCADSARGIRRAIDAGAAVINMSYASPEFCFLEYLQLQLATKRGVTLVAASGNEFENGNPVEYPGAMPHVLTVAALDAADRASFFSSSNAAIDLAAPGEGIVTAVPAQFDEDGTVDGYMALDGTSFAAPMVAAAAAWVRAERPELRADQVAQVVRLGARDIGNPGWEADSGFGILDVGGALSKPAPRRDPSEPNDEIVWVDGRAFGTPNAPISRNGRKVTVRALLDRFEDPTDVYRVRFPGRSKLRITVTPTFGDPDLQVFSGTAKDLGEEDQLVASSRRDGTRTDRVLVRNRSRGARTAYVAVYVDTGSRSLDAGYALRVRRAR
jgi:hypothetical protein